MKHTLSMKENRDFRRLYHRGKSAVTGLVVIYAAKNRLSYSRLGITVSVKIGGAVTRNRVKRLIREAYRLHEAAFPSGWDYVFVARSRACNAKCADMERAMLAAAETLGLRQKAAKGGKS